MGGASKRKNAGIGIDFRKAKYKVGKTLKKARNDTDTTIKSHSIHLPSQSLAIDKDGSAVTTRNLTLKELISQVSHYSAKSRRDALIGMGELFGAHPEMLLKNLGSILEALGERISDVDACVRSTLLKLLSETVLPKLTDGCLRSFVPLMMAHVCSSMTHLAMEVRGDALKFLNELMKYECEMIVTNFLMECLNHFADMCGNLGRSQTLRHLSQASKLKVLDAIRCFLEKVSAAQTTVNEGIASCIYAEDKILFQDRCSWLNSQNNQTRMRIHHQHGLATEPMSHAFERLLVCLTSMLTAGCAGLSEAGAPFSLPNTQFATAALDSLVYLLKLIRDRSSKEHGFLISGPSKEFLKSCKIITTRVHTCFPTVVPSVDAGQVSVELAAKFNVAASRLLLQAFLALSENHSEVCLPENLIAFYSDIIEKASNPEVLPDVLSLLPDVFCALSHLKISERLSLLEAIREICVSVQDIQTKLKFLQFFLDVIKARLKLGIHQSNDTEDQMIADWLKMLPKIMWDSGLKHVKATKVCLTILHTAARSQSPTIAQQMKEMQRELMLMFAIAKESSNKTGIRARPGHLHQLPLDLQETAVDIMYFLPSLSDLTLFTSLTICLMESFTVGICKRLLSVISEKCVSGNVSQRALLHLVLGLLTGDSEWKITGNKQDAMDWERSLVLCSAASELVWCAGDPLAIIHAVESELIRSFKLFATVDLRQHQLRKLYGLMSLIAAIRHQNSVSFEGEFEKLLPDILVHYWLAGTANEKRLFCKTLASWESPVLVLLGNSNSLLGKAIQSLHASCLSDLLPAKATQPIQMVKKWECKARVLYSLVLISSEVVITEKGILETIFSTMGNVLKSIIVETQPKNRFKLELGKCIAFCEHAWGEK